MSVYDRLHSALSTKIKDFQAWYILNEMSEKDEKYLINDINRVDSCGRTLLMLAMEKGFHGIAGKLLEFDSHDFSLRDVEGRSIVDYIRHPNESGFAAALRYDNKALIDYVIVNKDALVAQEDESVTPLVISFILYQRVDLLRSGIISEEDIQQALHYKINDKNIFDAAMVTLNTYRDVQGGKSEDDLDSDVHMVVQSFSNFLENNLLGEVSEERFESIIKDFIKRLMLLGSDFSKYKDDPIMKEVCGALTRPEKEGLFAVMPASCKVVFPCLVNKGSLPSLEMLSMRCLLFNKAEQNEERVGELPGAVISKMPLSFFV